MNETKTYQEIFKNAEEECSSFNTIDYSNLSRKDVLLKLHEVRSDEESLKVQEICAKLHDYKAYFRENPEVHKYSVLEGVITSVYHDVSNRLNELSAITTCPEMTESDLESLAPEVLATLELRNALENTLGKLIEMRAPRKIEKYSSSELKFL